MSICTTVFFKRPSPIDVDAWIASARLGGFDLEFDETFTPESHSCGLPVECSGVRASFEFYLGTVFEYLDEGDSDFSWWERRRIRRYTRVAEFVTHSRHDDLFAAIVSAASLAHSTKGALLDNATGRFIGHPRVLHWARAKATPPRHEHLIRRDRTVVAVHDWAAALLPQFGYERLSKAPGTSDRPESAWFFREGETFQSEMLEVAVDSDLAQFWLCLSFYGSPLPLATLRDRGLEGNAAGWYLYQYDPPGRDESATPPLPQNIPVDELFSTSTEAQRLEGELREADRALFRHLFESVKDEDWKTSDV